ncbi:MAG: glycosyltransferase family 4 protein [Candidatus Kerfeldbacteria bacterium]|nr:glycosyltransferase family 4 protein [Candidatus Kerfeldbacteria bacterium]
MTIGLLNPTVLMRRPIAELASVLQSRGHEVTILTPATAQRHWAPSHYESASIRVVELPSVEIRRVLWSLPSWTAIKRLWAAVREYDVLQIWAPYYLVAVLPIIFAKLRRSPTKVIVTLDTIPGFSFRFDSIIDPLMVWYHRLICSWLFRLVDARTLYSAQLLPFARQAWLGSKFTILPTGIHPPEFRPRTRIADAPAALLFIGIINARKGVAVLLQAMAILGVAGRSYTLTIVGDGPERQQMEELARQLGLQDTVTFVGRSSQIETYYTAADVLILPSYGEGLPGVVMEAMAYGVPVVATDIPCLTELIPDGHHGQLVPLGRADAVASGIIRYLDDEPYRQSVIRSARRRIESFSWSAVVPRYETLYDAA